MIHKYLNQVKDVLLVQPPFPSRSKSHNHSDFCPIGLLKIASYLRQKNITPHLVNGLSNEISIKPQLIMITTLFTYYSKYVKQTVEYYRKLYPNTPIIGGGGVYASLLPQHCKEYCGFDDVITGVIPEAENLTPSYDLVDVDYQIIHTTRGCIRNCDFCGVYKVEPTFNYKKTIKDEIIKPKVIFYDNNFLANPYIKKILNELIELKKQHKIKYIESQSGFDGRLLLKQPYLAKMIKKAGFQNVRIAWDHGIEDKSFIEKQIKLLVHAGYNPNSLWCFMVYNFDIPYNEMEEKRLVCYNMGVRIADCRYRPLDSTYDEYNPWKKQQDNIDYYIHPLWTDEEVRLFRRNVRRHNLCIQRKWSYHSYTIERLKLPLKTIKKYKNKTYDEMKNILNDCWNPAETHKIMR